MAPFPNNPPKNITQVAAGDYEINVEAATFHPKTVLQKVKVGTVSTLDIAITKA